MAGGLRLTAERQSQLLHGSRSGAPCGSDAPAARSSPAARECLATDRYERAGTRAVAKAANIDPPMVRMRYCRNKGGLCAAAVAIDLRLPDESGAHRRQHATLMAAQLLGLAPMRPCGTCCWHRRRWGRRGREIVAWPGPTTTDDPAVPDRAESLRLRLAERVGVSFCPRGSPATSRPCRLAPAADGSGAGRTETGNPDPARL
ncbi:hypothetical protein GCM10009730_44790 [Streptomyces albidochromogenes]